jgi:tetratricopeptide (TPR) repeat protein
MRRLGLHGIRGLAAAIIVIMASALVATANPKERIDHWRKNYEELWPTEDARAARAHSIFQRVLHTAGKRLGVVPRLFITKSDPLNIALPIALPDGWIILSKGTLDICYRDPERGDDRLAFVLAHEIAHQLKDDFWHMKFFQAIEASEAQDPQRQKVLVEIRDIASVTEQVLAKELQADEQGSVYAAMAGFDTNAIVIEDNKNQFFEDWVRALDPRRISGVSRGSHPTPQHRAATVKARLRQILDRMEVFKIGLWFYQAGNYPKAILAFEHFLHFFPSREVYHNLATSHHQVALQYYGLWRHDAQTLPFKLSLAIDPVTRASTIALRGSDRQGKSLAELFQEHVERAIEFYKTAISLDPSYVLSYNNLGCALLLKEDAYKAIATLQDALKLAPDSAETLNNLGVAFFYAENPRQARAHLAKAREQSPTYDAPVFNLGKIAYAERQEAEAKQHWTTYVQLDPVSPWAELLRKQMPLSSPPPRMPSTAMPATETVLGLAVAAFESDIPRAWGAPRTVSRIPLEQEPFRVAGYPNGVTTLSQDEEILMIVALEGYRGKSARGVAIGSSGKDVFVQYRSPSRILKMTQGESWVYDAQGIAFQLRDGTVVSWVLF